MSNRRLICCFSVPVLALMMLAPLQAQPVADYDFADSLSDALGNGAPLQVLAPAGTPPGGEPRAQKSSAAGGAFSTVTLDGRSVSAWDFPMGSGFELELGPLLPRDSYSVALLFSLSATQGYAKLMDIDNRRTDRGLYVQGNDLNAYPLAQGATDAILPDVLRQVTVTRGADNLYVGYVDGVEQFRFDDSALQTVISDERRLAFFRDDNATSGEDRAGRVVRIRLFDRALSGAEVLALEADRIPPGIFRGGGFEAAP